MGRDKIWAQRHSDEIFSISSIFIPAAIWAVPVGEARHAFTNKLKKVCWWMEISIWRRHICSKNAHTSDNNLMTGQGLHASDQIGFEDNLPNLK